MYDVDNIKIGAYLKKLIEKKYPSHRQFCKAYLEMIGTEATNEELRKMGNRMSQILKGKKGIQIYDLPVFTDLLGVSCEEILSCGKCFVPTSSHVTNYDIAFSHDPKVWKKYVERDDKLILNCDEYGKTILDYIFEFKNYAFLKYLIDKKLIWLVDNSGWDGYTYGAGTSIKRRETVFIDTSMPMQIKYEDQIRMQAVALAIENGDYSTLDFLCARENPGLHMMSIFLHNMDSAKYYNDNMVTAIANSDESILDYFSEEFEVEDEQKRKHKFIYPYIGSVIDLMLQNKRKESELLIRRTLVHNKRAYEILSRMVDDAYKANCDSLWSELDKSMEAHIREQTLSYLYFSDSRDMVSFFCSTGRKSVKVYVTNIVNITETASTPLLNDLIEESNEWYYRIVSMKGAQDE